MLKNVPPIISPEFLKVLCEMGHGDRIVIADANFPSENMGKNCKVIRCDGHSGCDILDAVLSLLPLDEYVDKPVNLMAKVPGDTVETPIWDDYAKIVAKHEPRGENLIECIERQAYYEDSKNAYAIVATGEKALYANITLQKGTL